jgi:hypothetical protein
MTPKAYQYLLEASERPPEDELEYWKHGEAGDVIQGIVTGMVYGLYTRAGRRYDVLTISNPDTGVLTGVPLWRAALAGRIRDLRPRVNEAIRIEYLGMEESRAGRHFHAYRVLLVDEQGQRVFRRSGPEPGPDAPPPGPYDDPWERDSDDPLN